MKRILPLLLLLTATFTLSAQVAAAGAHPTSSKHDIFDADGRLKVRIIYTYGEDGIVETRTLQSFDNNGRKTREETYTPDELLLFTEDNRYNRQGQLTKTVQIDYDESGIPHKNTFEYRYSHGTRLTILNGQPIPPPEDQK